MNEIEMNELKTIARDLRDAIELKRSKKCIANFIDALNEFLTQF